MSNETQYARGYEIGGIEISKSQVRSVVLHLGLYGFAGLFLVPYVWMASTSIKPEYLIYDSSPHWLTTDVTFEWYRVILFESPVVSWTIATFALAAVGTLVVVLVDSMAAYALARLEWPGRRIVMGIILASFMVPAAVNLIPIYAIVSELGLVNNLLGIIFPYAAGVFGVFMLYQFFKNIPEELEEAARLDGFSTTRIFFRIAVPMQFPAIAALGLFSFIGLWNSFLWPLIILQNEAMYTLPIGLVTLETQEVTDPGLVMSGAIIASAPLLILFLAMQDYLFKAVALQGTVK
ncbi:carbohydrate ABC transporter permease [Halostagnicola sp. A-GB9-2]|uniref:carbohydrate ABC transporter permease n=1 Tax=Halostagnicola sp. A-GB9-2 TaxID=3048066 RepID=UPI0024C0BD74|nr:carbohydrate ABC transporter permease [Halostagnicola sp. A-GB9-2]MDJ1433664.1 carbohydrate ABC transporter permease [Halostagnicola sp. A-GB9-2]